MEIIKAMKTKLRWFGIQVDGPTFIFCDKYSVIKSVSMKASIFTKPRSINEFLAFFLVGNIVLISKNTEGVRGTNLADLFL